MDDQFLAELYDAIESDPFNIEARTILFETWMLLGNEDAALSIAQEIIDLDPTNQLALDHLSSGKGKAPAYASSSSSAPPRPPVLSRNVPRNDIERLDLEQEFENIWCDVSTSATEVFDKSVSTFALAFHRNAVQLRNAAHIKEGKMGKVFGCRPPPVRQLVRSLPADDREAALALILADMETTVQWAKSTHTGSGDADPRDRLMKRRQILEAALPPDLQALPAEAFMHIEHELLGKKYVNDETMLGDTIGEIPRSNFLATEDGYAWDMEELAQALTANNGVMRNPLSKDLFSPDDVRQIMAHPLGARLRPLQLEQASLKNGVRKETITQLEKLSKTLLADMTDDAGQSRKAVDEFLVFVATLPTEEQRTLDVLKIPGSDSHTGQAFDYSVGESVRDAKANRTCFHKVGDFLGQAATWLRK